MNEINPEGRAGRTEKYTEETRLLRMALRAVELLPGSEDDPLFDERASGMIPALHAKLTELGLLGRDERFVDFRAPWSLIGKCHPQRWASARRADWVILSIYCIIIPWVRISWANGSQRAASSSGLMGWGSISNVLSSRRCISVKRSEKRS